MAEADYNEAVDKALRTYKRKANVPGFRPGMVPMSIINKMYRKGVVAEEAYRAASNGCFDYIEKEKLTLVGDMIPSEKQQPLDFENSTEYEFAFEVGLAPEINIPLSKKDKVKKYTIAIEDKMREGYRSNFTRRFGKLVDVDTVEKEDALNVTLDQPEMKIEEAYVGLIGMSDAARKPFLGKKVGDTMEVDVNELYPTPAQRAAILQVKEDELEGINPKFTLTITKIRRFTEPELNDEFFKMAFPEGNVKNADEFAQYIDSQISRDLSRESDFLFTLDIRRMLLAGADKTSVNTAAILRPDLIREGAERFGSQCIVLAIDARRVPGENRWKVFTHGGRNETELDAVEWAVRGVELGAGEILLTSMDADGTCAGYDCGLTRAVSDAVGVPVIASGGAGTLEHLAEVLDRGRADAVLAASIFHFGTFTVPQAKEFLKAKGIPVRPVL